MIKLKERLSRVFSEVPEGSVVADIGADHGKLSASLIETKRASRVIAVDISADSLSKTEELSKKLGIEIDARVGDGLTAISKEDGVDVVVIAGMGGYEIMKILSSAKITFDRYILLPHQNAKELRQFVKDKFFIEKDYVVKENGKYYSLIVLTKGTSDLTETDVELGKDLTSVLAVEMLTERLKKYKKYIKNVQNIEEKEEMQSKSAMIERVLICQKQ